MDEYVRNIFHGSCPYTGETCETFDCDNCAVEAFERLWLNAEHESEVQDEN